MNKKKIHFINTLVLILLILGFIGTSIIAIYFTTPGDNGDIGVGYLAGLFFIFAGFWIFMKFGEFLVENNNDCKK